MRFRRICRVPFETTGSNGTQTELETYKYSRYVFMQMCIRDRGLYFIGEVLDLDAVTGGFNLQIAWSTARAAADYIE